jgi:hypothetical protein
VLSYEPEIQSLRAQLGDARTNALLARERRETFSLHPELRITAWAGAMLLATAAGILLKNNLERIGPIALASIIGVAALACYVWSWRAAQPRNRATAQPITDYILLLGALLVSADVGYLESQFHLLDRHSLLLLAVVHAAGAYAYGSRLVLSLSIAALAGWMGAEERRSLDLFLTSALVIGWREIHRRLGGTLEFLRVFEHFAANLALWGALLLLDKQRTFDAGCILTIVLAAGVIWWGRVQRSEPFVLYGFVYAVIAADALILRRLHETTAIAFTLLVSMIVAVAVLVRLHHEHRT